MKKTVKVQGSGTNIWVNVPREIRDALSIEKGQTLLLTVKDNKIIIEK